MGVAARLVKPFLLCFQMYFLQPFCVEFIGCPTGHNFLCLLHMNHKRGLENDSFMIAFYVLLLPLEIFYEYIANESEV